MRPPTGTDVAVAVAIALLVVLLAVTVWPGYARVRASDIEGNWADENGRLFHITANQGSENEIVILSAGHHVGGEVHWLRGITAGSESGRVSFDGNIEWDSGSTWIRQGVKPRASSR